MARPARFTFDLNLAAEHPRGPGPVAVVPSVPEDVVAQLVAQAREDAYAEGRAEGERNAAAMAAQTLSAAATALATRSAEMAAALDGAMGQARSEAIELAASVGRKLALHLLARQPTVELEALIADCLQSIGTVPHLVIRCHPDLADAIKDLATGHMATSGFAGRLVVLGDPEQRLGDGRLEWVDGGLVRDIAAIGADIDRRITHYISAQSGAQQEAGH